jgi:hypothetical protein
VKFSVRDLLKAIGEVKDLDLSSEVVVLVDNSVSETRQIIKIESVDGSLGGSMLQLVGTVDLEIGGKE